MTLHELRPVDIETEKVRHAWAKAQIEVSGASRALLGQMVAFDLLVFLLLAR
jgi:hypothetical protein